MNAMLRKICLLLLLVGTVSALAPQYALSAPVGTPSSTQINNKATVNYQVGAVAQTPVESSPTGNATPGVGNGTNTSFYVANKVNPVAAKTGDATVTPGSTKQALVFTLTNMGNSTQGYNLTTATTGTTPMSNVNVYIDSGTTPNQWDASDHLWSGPTDTWTNNLASGATVTILIVADTGLSGTNGQTESFSLVATTYLAGGGGIQPQTGAGAPASLQNSGANVDVVFADAAGSAAGDNQYDGKHSASGTYTVSAPVLTVTKTTAVYKDPITNGGAASPNAKAIPGATMTYTITIANAAGAGQTAQSVSISDAVPANTTFATQFNDGVTPCAALNGIVVNGACKTNTNDGDGADFNLTTPGAVTVTGLSVAPNASTIIKFQVTVN
jgi:hypothetical protein